MPDITLSILPRKTASDLPYQHLHIQITSDNGLIAPVDLKGLVLPPELIPSHGIVIEGKAPIWLYGYLVHACHASAWVACFDPRLGEGTARSGGAVVIESHSTQVQVGEVLVVDIPDEFYPTRS